MNPAISSRSRIKAPAKAKNWRVTSYEPEAKCLGTYRPPPGRAGRGKVVQERG
jgi:hypothetical protein